MSVAGIKSGPARDPLLGARIDGRYRIRAVHGRGGMGVVYSAVHEDLRRDVAVKVLDKSWASDRTAIERFLQEARTASGLSHGNIVDVLDLGRLPDGRPYLVMPLIVGSDLATVLAEEGPQHPKRVASLLSGVASGLDLIHAKGLVHHDIKPENLMQVRREDGSETVLVLDFGIAGARYPTDGRGMELFDRGTPEFMPPEAASGVVPDRRGDIYALATVAFELMTGRLPFDSADDAELATLKATRPPSSMTFASGLSFPLALEAVVARGLATRPAERYATAGEFVRRLAHVAAQIADDFLTHQRAAGSAGPMLQPPANRPPRRAVASRSRTLMTAGGLRMSAAAQSAVSATGETAPTEPPSDLAAPAQQAAPAGFVVETAPAQAAAAQAAAAQPAPADSSNTSQTQPQMHAVSVPPSAPGDRAQAFAEASAEASGARALPREGDARASEAPASAAINDRPSASVAPRPSWRSSTISSAHGPLAPVRDPARSSATPTLTPAVLAASDALHPSGPSPLPMPAAETNGPNNGSDRVDPLAPTLTNMMAPGASSSAGSAAAAAAAEAGPATMLEWGPTEASGTFLRDEARDEAPAARPESSQQSAGPSLTQPHGSVSPASARSAALRASSAQASGRHSGVAPISAPPPAAGADPDDEAILVVDANDTSVSPFPPPPDHPLPPEPSLVAPRALEPADYDTDDDSDADEIDALYAMAASDDRITDPPDEFRSRRTVLLHPAMLTVYGGALLFWLYAVLPEQNPQAEELPAPSAAVPLAPYSPTPPPPAASAPVPSAAPALALPGTIAAPPAAEAIAPSERVPAPAADDARRAHRPRARQAREQRPAVREPRAPRAIEQADDAAPVFARQPIAPLAARDGRSAAELTREAEDAILRGDSAGAAQLYDRAIAADASYAPAFRGKGLVMERLGRPEQAADAFRTFLRLSPGSASAAKVRERLEALDAQ